MKHIQNIITALASVILVTTIINYRKENQELSTDLWAYQNNPFHKQTLVLTVKKIGDHYYPANQYTNVFCLWENLNAGFSETPCKLHESQYKELKYDFGVSFEHTDTIDLSWPKGDRSHDFPAPKEYYESIQIKMTLEACKQLCGVK